MLSFLDQFNSARKCGVPLTGVETVDPAATMRSIAINCSTVKVNGKEINPPVLTWDCIQGFAAIAGTKTFEISNALAKKLNDKFGVQVISQPIAFLEAIADDGADGDPPTLPAWTIVGMLNAGDFFDKAEVRQGIWNLRDKFKRNGRMLVLLGIVVDLPPNLKSGDVVVMEDELPSDEELAKIVARLDQQASRCCSDKDCKKCNGTGIKVKRPLANEEAVERIVEAVKGLSAFGAEQVVAMALRTQTVENQAVECGFDLDHCWTAKRKQIEQIKGLTIFRDNAGFDAIGGLEEIKSYFTKVMNGRRKPKLIVWLDEIEKSGLDSQRSGSDDTSTDQEGELLKFMEDYRVFGVMLVGVPGCGKSQLCKALAGEFDRVVIRLDLGGLKDKWVGSSQQNLRTALKMIRNIGGDRTMWVATSNSIEGLSDAMKSRYTDVFMFDLPTKEERDVIWDVWTEKLSLTDTVRPNDEGWVARDIVHCCEKAYTLNETLVEAGTRIIAEGVKTRESISRMRAQADGRYSSTTHRGPYKTPVAPAPVHETERAMAE